MVIETIPTALILGCNTPHGINVLSDWIEEQTGHPPDFHQSGWSNFSYDHGFAPGDSIGKGCGYAYGDGFGYHYGTGDYGPDRGNGYGCGCGDWDGHGCGDGRGYGNRNGDNMIHPDQGSNY